MLAQQIDSIQINLFAKTMVIRVNRQWWAFAAIDRMFYGMYYDEKLSGVKGVQVGFRFYTQFYINWLANSVHMMFA